MKNMNTIKKQIIHVVSEDTQSLLFIYINIFIYKNIHIVYTLTI